ncbi:MAG: hypothetical protein AB7J13_00705 [Pyrinomonadaceae bacterium]
MELGISYALSMILLVYAALSAVLAVVSGIQLARLAPFRRVNEAKTALCYLVLEIAGVINALVLYKFVGGGIARDLGLLFVFLSLTNGFFFTKAYFRNWYGDTPTVGVADK